MSENGFTTCLWFDGQALDAAQYYVSIFEDSSLGRITHTTAAGPAPAGEILTVEFELNGQRFVGLNGGPEFTFTPAISFQVDCHSQEEVDYYYARLLEGGAELQCGWVTDRYGVSWQVVPTVLIEMVSDPDPDRAARVTEAMLSMKKLDIAALQRAYDAAG
ncbi:VOC family protein [Spiractinospora alimapuensis]|uniref:VOC family protein n=1 Tax=Spiractinospora alimapuensis TaxID=2820884 RepID=UPI001F26C670|nr:VOC family protein [Spiractinospora alimapuensis]QVQ52483.1 VOC family protein [Spiractinospora alimapuensis]